MSEISTIREDGTENRLVVESARWISDPERPYMVEVAGGYDNSGYIEVSRGQLRKLRDDLTAFLEDSDG